MSVDYLTPNNTAAALSDMKWPNNPFHSGEISLQQETGVHEHVMSYAPMFIRQFLPQQHREFYTKLPFLVIATRDTSGNMWSTLLEKQTESQTATRQESNPYFISSPDDETLHIQATPVLGDALYGIFDSEHVTKSEGGIDVGILGIEFDTARRNRVNGRVTEIKKNNNNELSSLIFNVDQSFGNCPQYIKRREKWWSHSPTEPILKSLTTEPDKSKNTERRLSVKLTKEQIKMVESAETVFTATGFRGNGNDVRYGNDASHRGGPGGFMQVETSTNEEGVEIQTIIWNEFKGNGHFNSLGNILMDDRIGISIPNFSTGGMLQVSGTATIEFVNIHRKERRVRMMIKYVNELTAGSLPIRWNIEENDELDVKVFKIVQESENVKSFYLKPSDDRTTLWGYKPGQHIPVSFKLPSGEIVTRNYSLSSPKNVAETGYYRISVKHEKDGLASSFLHHSMKEETYLRIGKPTGDFFIDKNTSDRPTVLLSAGIGVTPILPLLYEKMQQKLTSKSKVYWMQGARNEDNHPFQQEVDDIKEQAPTGILETHIFCSQPNNEYNYFSGRINIDAIQRHVPEWSEAVYYMCGPSSFLASIQEGLERIGIDNSDIHFESF